MKFIDKKAKKYSEVSCGVSGDLNAFTLGDKMLMRTAFKAGYLQAIQEAAKIAESYTDHEGHNICHFAAKEILKLKND